MGGGVRSSARLNGGAGRSVPRAASARSAAADAAARAAAAERRARAAERAREVEDNPRVLRDKCRRLARAVREAKHLVVYTGAGISTAADIPDYRGPHGVWTRLQRGEPVGRVEVARAQPTFTHMALTALWRSGLLKFVVSQNCDGLHVRAGMPRRALAELHGDMFAEQCAACRRVYLRTFDTTERTARYAHGTRRLCHTCGRELRDTIVHFGERGRAAWPLNWAGALRHAAAADVVLCLGSSLKVLRRYPRLWRMQRAPHARPALYIVNLQWTPKDAVAALKINARCDTVMAAVARRLRLRVPRYSARRDPLLAHGVPLAPLEAHTARRAPLSPPALDADSDSDACYSLRSASPSPSPSSSSASDDSDAGSSDSDDRVPLHRLAQRLRASRAPPHTPHIHHTALAADRDRHRSPAMKRHLDYFRSFQVSMHSCEATILLRAEHAPSVLPPPEPPPPLHRVPAPAPPSRQIVSTSHTASIICAPSVPTGYDIQSLRLQSSVPSGGGSASAASHMISPINSSYYVPTSFASESRAATGDLRRFRMQRLAGPVLKNGIDALANGHRSPPALDRKFITVKTPNATVKEEDRESIGNGTWSCGSRLRRLLELTSHEEDKKGLAAELEQKHRPDGATRHGGDAAGICADRKCKVQLPVAAERYSSDIKSEMKGSSGECASSTPLASKEQGEMREAELAAAAFIRRAVLVCRASLYPGLHTILGGARGCAWCTRRYGSRRCLWYGAPPDAVALRTARRVRGRRYLCACCPERGARSPLPDDAGWYGKGYRKGRRRRR